MNFLEPLRMKISSQEDTVLSDEEEDSYYLAIEFPDEDVKAYVKSDSILFPGQLLEFNSIDSADRYANEHFPGMIHFVEKKKNK